MTSSDIGYVYLQSLYIPVHTHTHIQTPGLMSLINLGKFSKTP